MAKFEIKLSPNLTVLRDRLADLDTLAGVADLKFDTETREWFDPNDPQGSRLSFDDYIALQERAERDYDQTAHIRARRAYQAEARKTQRDYDLLKQSLATDAAVSGDPNSTKLIFDDAAQSVGIDYGFKEFMDRVSRETLKQVKEIADPVGQYAVFQDLFRNELATPATAQGYAGLFDDVTAAYRDQGAAAYKDAPPMPNDPAAAPNAGGSAAAALAGQAGLCLDDNHGTADATNFLTDNMAGLKQQGVDTLFIEHLWQEYQPMLDDYVSGRVNDLPKPLETALGKLDGGGDRFKRLVETAKAQGMRLVGLDSFEAKTPQDGDPRSWDERAVRFNATAADVVNREKGNGQFVLMAGGAHNNTHFSGFPGLAQILGVPTVEAKGGKLAVSKETEQRGMRSEAEQAYYDAFIGELKAQDPDLFRPRPDDIAENNNATQRGIAVAKAANSLARSAGADLAMLQPDAVKRLATQAATRTLTSLQTGTLSSSDMKGVGRISAAATGLDDTARATVDELRRAVARNQVADVIRILDANPNDERLLLSVTNPGLLHWAADRKDAALTKLLLARGYNPDFQDAGGNTALHVAVGGVGHIPPDVSGLVVQELVSGGARADLKNKLDDTPVNQFFTGKYANPGADPQVVKRRAEFDKVNAELLKHADYDAAKQPAKLSHIFGLVNEGDLSAVQALPSDHPWLNTQLGDKSLVHVAAEGRHTAVLQELVNKGADIKAVDGKGNNALHYACTDGTDDLVLANYLMGQLGKDAANHNQDGRTALHEAAYNNLPSITGMLLRSPEAHRFDIPDETDTRPIDRAIGRSNVSTCEQEFYAVDPSLDPTGPGIANPSVVQMLSWMTRSQSPGDFPPGFMEGLYRDMYADPILRPVLEIAARDGAGSRSLAQGGPQAFRINVSNNEGAFGAGGMGNYMPEGNRLNVGGKQNAGKSDGKGYWLDSVKGTLIHELTHHAATVAYDNDGLPVPKGTGQNANDPTAVQNYVDAFEKDVKLNSHLAVTDEEKTIRTNISSRLSTYAKGLDLGGASRNYTASENLMLEIIVGVSQAIAQFGRPLVEKMYPSLVAHYESEFNAAITSKCQTDPRLSQPQIDTAADGANQFSPNPVSAKAFKPVTELDSGSVLDMIKSDYVLNRGAPNATHPPGAPIYDVSCLKLDVGAQKELDRRLKEIGGLVEKALASSGLPPCLSADSLRKLVHDVSAACGTAGNDKDLRKLVEGHVKSFAATAEKDFDEDYVLSAKICLDRKLTKEYTLSAREIAELVLVRGAERAAGTTADKQTISLSPDKCKQALAFFTQQLEGLGSDKLKAIQASPDTFVNAQVDTLIKDKDFYVKGKAARSGSGHVSLDVKSLKKAWVTKLKQFA